MITLGINAAFHDSAAALVKDGRVLAAAEEERFTRIKHGKRPTPFAAYELPFHAIAYCLKHAKLTMSDVDQIGYSFDPELLPHSAGSTITLPMEPSAARVIGGNPWDGLFHCYVKNAPRQLASGAPHHLRDYFEGLRPAELPFHFLDHHLCHAASAFLPSPFKEAAVLTLDGRGETATTTYSFGSGASITRLGEVALPHSLGLLYEDLTRYLGFLHSSDEFKVMALASFGEPAYETEIRSLINLAPNGQYEISPPNFPERFGPPRKRAEQFCKRHFDLAHSVQRVLEDVVLELCRHLHRATSAKYLALAGGVALNCVLNSKIRDEGPFDELWIQPAAGDAGTALGAALWLDAQGGDGNRDYVMEDAFLGPSFSSEEIGCFLSWAKVRGRRVDNVPEETARLLAANKIIGWFQGRMEFGPRALGARSILASPIDPAMQDKLNEIKEREDFRPVAPVVLEEALSDWFEPGAASPFMLFVHRVRPDKADKIPAVKHVDNTARVQTVRQDQHATLYALLSSFQLLTGAPVLVNTSFNTRSEPIVCTPKDALESFWSSPLDALVLEDWIIEK